MIKILLASLAAGSVLISGMACEAEPKTKPNKKVRTAKTAEQKWRDGTFEVGVEIQPGKYKTISGSDAGCLWERLRGVSGDPKDIINNMYGKGRMKMEVQKSDKYINFSGGCVWVKK